MRPAIRSFSVNDINGYCLFNIHQYPVSRPYDPSRRYPRSVTPMATRLAYEPPKSVSNSIAEFAFGVALGSVFAIIMALIW